MKLLITIILFAVIPHLLHSQINLVVNGGFENGNYNGGTDPTTYYSNGQMSCNAGQQRFEDDINDWWVANPTGILNTACSPDWIPAGISLADGSCPAHDSYFIRSASSRESIVSELSGGTTLIKGETYHFKIRVRLARGYEDGPSSFQLVFSTKEEGLEVQPQKKWVALDNYVNQSCEWQTIDTYFTVPNDNENDYEDMKYLVLQYNHEIDGLDDNGQPDNNATMIIHYDDVILIQEEECIDIKYIQNREYTNEATIVQANQQIIAGEDVSPHSWDDIGPVVVKSGSAVIYRAPVVTLDPNGTGGFVVEGGAYFETENLPCVADPCPNIPQYNSEVSTICGGNTVTLGANLPVTAGVFYSWSPQEYFSSPWSNTTDFTPPATGSGCIDANLTIWTICGPTQTFPFNVSYFDIPASVTFGSVINNANQFSFDVNVFNATSYSIEVLNTTTNEILYEGTEALTCAEINDMAQESLSFNSCTNEMCGSIQVTVTAENDCFGAITETLIWNGPAPTPPSFDIENIITGMDQHSFDINNISSGFEYLQIKVYNSNFTQLYCVETIFGCDQPNLSNYSFDAAACILGCVSQCEDYQIQVILKSNCITAPLIQTVNWDKPYSSLIAPGTWPNVITDDEDGINEELCFNVLGADYYDLVVTNSWGNTLHESSGCITESPWCPYEPEGFSDGVYFYIIEFSNSCGQSILHQDFYQYYGTNGGRMADTSGTDNSESFDDMSFAESFQLANNEITVTDSSASKNDLIIYPNPTNSISTIYSSSEILNLVVLDAAGKSLLVQQPNLKRVKLDMSAFSQGVYLLQIQTVDRAYTKELILFR